MVRKITWIIWLLLANCQHHTPEADFQSDLSIDSAEIQEIQDFDAVPSYDQPDTVFLDTSIKEDVSVDPYVRPLGNKKRSEAAVANSRR